MLFFPLFIRLAVGRIGESQSANLVPTRPSIRLRNLPDLRDAPWLPTGDLRKAFIVGWNSFSSYLIEHDFPRGIELLQPVKVAYACRV
jgi:hypothetical protein